MSISMRIHWRTQIVLKAKSDMDVAVLKLVNKYGLTAVEVVTLLLQSAESWNVFALRQERHPKEPDKKADEA